MWRALVFLAATLSICAAQDARGLRARYGEPYLQRFRIDAQTSVTVRYNVAGEVCGLQVAPAGFDSGAAAQERYLPAFRIAQIVNRFIPGYVETRGPGAPAALEEFQGWQIRHRYREANRKDELLFAQLAASSRCSPETAASLEQQYGAAEYERFSVQLQIALGAAYAPDRSLKRVEIRRYSVDFNEDGRPAQGANEAAAGRVLEEVLTAPVRRALVRRAASLEAGRQEELYQGDRVKVTRYSAPKQEQFLGYSIEWR